MRYAPIAAPQWARHYQRGDYHMVIAPWVLQEPGIGQYYAEAARPPDVWVLMDNGAWEGYELSLDEIVRAGGLIAADEVVLPDVLHKGKATLKASWDAYLHLRRTAWPMAAGSQGDLPVAMRSTGPKCVMFVPQGRTTEGWRRCRDAWVNLWEREERGTALSIGINQPRAEDCTRKRSDLIVETVALGFPVHLLGIPDLQQFLHIELPLAHSHGVRGVDSSLPFALGADGVLLMPNALKIPLGTPDIYRRISTRNRRLISLNIAIMHQWVASGAHSWFIPIDLVRRVAIEGSATYEDEQLIYENLATALKGCGVPEGAYQYDVDMVLRVIPATEGWREESDKYVEVMYAPM